MESDSKSDNNNTKYKEYQSKWRQEHPDYQKKYRETKLKGVKICDTCNGVYAKSYLYGHGKKCKSVTISHDQV